MRKLTPVSFTAEQSEQIQEQLGVQELAKAAPKSRDPINFPVFEIPVNKKVLIYVPNHVTQSPEGVDCLRMDKPLIHAVTVGKRYLNYRCITGIVNEAHGFDGECPLCNAVSEPWDLANAIIADKCATLGLNPEDTDNKDVKNIRSNAFSDRVLKDAMRYYTFPIVVIDTVNDDGKTPVMGENNQISYKVMWYSISEQQYEEKWVKSFESMESEPTHPGGNFFMLNYCYTPKSGEPNKRDSAKALVVLPKSVKNSENLRKALDKATEEWTPAKAQETVINNNIYSPADLEAVTDECLEGTRNLLSLYAAKELQNVSTAETKEGEFNLEKKPEETQAAIEMDATDIDME